MKKINLPILMTFFDKFEMETFEERCKTIMPSIKCYKLGFDFGDPDNDLVAIFYTKKDSAFEKLKKDYDKQVKEYNSDEETY